MVSEEYPPDVVVGIVKWFDPSKGFGFVVVEGMNSDILLHANALRNFGLSSVCDGAGIRIAIQETARGFQTVEVLEVQPPATDTEDRGISDTHPGRDVDTSVPLEPARVKWFDKVKGFGFANVFGKASDVFIHMETLRRSGLAELQAGEAIAVRVIDGERGRMAVSIEPWESGLDDPARGTDRDASS